MLATKAKYAQLPALPAIAQKIMALDPDAESAQDELIAAICQCPVTTARIIFTVNSASMWSGHKTTSVREAVTRLGMTNAYATAHAIAAFSIKEQRPDSKLDVDRLWRHNMDIVTVMNEISKRLPTAVRPSWPDIALTGLLHDIGMIVFDSVDPEASDRFHSLLGEGEPDRAELEIKLFGTTHNVLGAELLASWEIPEKIVTAIRHHHDLSFSSAKMLPRIIAKAEHLIVRSAATVQDQNFAVVDEASWDSLGVSKNQLDALRNDLKDKGISLSF